MISIDLGVDSGYVHPDNPLRYSMGWGISLSSVFAQFSAADLVGDFDVTEERLVNPDEIYNQ